MIGLDFKKLVSQIKELVNQVRRYAYQQVNTLSILTKYETGRLIVEYEQQGSEKAEYGAETLKKLSEILSHEFGRGYSIDSLERMRKFYIIYKNRISATPLRELMQNEKSEALSRILVTEKSDESILNLSWSHFILLMKMDNHERDFYEIEAVHNNWSFRELQRQYNSSLYERVALSRNKDEVKKLSKSGQTVDKPSDILKQPYVLEFLGLKEEPAYSESQLESAIIDKIEQFLLELGKGFLFEARQKRISFEDDHFYIDLVFYNRILRCYVLIDLKIGRLTHQDIGQMQMYVNFFDRNVKTSEENRTVGIILCKESNRTVVEFTLAEGQDQIFPREYKLYLPKKEELRKQLELAIK